MPNRALTPLRWMNNMGTLEMRMQGTAKTQSSWNISVAFSRRSWCAYALAFAVGLAALAGCKVSEKDLDEWGATKDSGRLAKAVADSKQKQAIRVKAALWLVKIRRMVELEKALKKSSKGDQKKIAAAVIKDLTPKLANKKADPGDRALAKDGLFSAWYFADPKERRGVEALIIDWFLGGHHGEAHEHSIAKILDAFGRRGANLLAQKTPYYDPNFFRYHNRTVVSQSCLLGRFWTRLGPEVRVATVKRYIATAKKNVKAALINSGALLCGIGLLGKRAGSRYLASVMATHPNIKMKAGAALALRLAATVDKKNLDPDVRGALVRELGRLIAKINRNKELDNPIFRGGAYLLHLMDLVTKMDKTTIFKELEPVIGAASPKLTDAEMHHKRTQVKLLTIGYLMRIDPEKALKLAYAKLTPEEEYRHGYLNGTLMDNAVYVWRKYKALRPKLLKGLRLGLTGPNWLCKIIAVESLAMKELKLRQGVAGDIAAIKKLTEDKTKLKGDDWKDATLGQRAKKAIEVLSKKK